MHEQFDTITEWLALDNARRQGRYRRDADLESFLFGLNADLAAREASLPAPEEPPHPVLMFFGVPRCGKTFFSQLVCDTLELGYVDNIAARFWRAPVHGLRLSRILAAERGSSDFSSDYGKTRALTDPHDFHYFWHHWLRITGVPYDALAVRSRLDFDGLGRQLRRMSDEWGGPAMMKAIHTSYHPAEILAAYPKAVFVLLERDPIDAARSLLKARLDNYGTPEPWYGQAPRPERYAELADLAPEDQIAGQLRGLAELYEEELARVPEASVVRVRYDAFCADPMATIEHLEARCAALGSPVARRCDIDPGTIRFSTHSEDETWTRLAHALERIDWPLRLPRAGATTTPC